MCLIFQTLQLSFSDFVLKSDLVVIPYLTMDAVKDTLHAQLAQLRTKLDDIPALQKLEVSCSTNLLRKKCAACSPPSHFFLIHLTPYSTQ
jgi:hypothetical protein